MTSDSTPLTRTQNGTDVIRHVLTTISSSSGVYRMLNTNGEVIYVGKARHLKNRVGSYLNLPGLSKRIQMMVMATASMEIITTASEAEALLLESNLIKKFQPRYNILLKDDKSFPYIQISSNHPYPRISKYRGALNSQADYLGPFVSAAAVDETITFLQRAFLLRPCSDNIFKNRSRPCLQYQIKRCSAPCVEKIAVEDYRTLIEQAKGFLNGDNTHMLEQLNEEMQRLSNDMQFEKAAVLRDRIAALNYMQQQVPASSEVQHADVMAVVREGKHACVQVFSFRNQRNFGNQSFFPAHAEEASEAEILEAFIGQFYEKQPVPPLVLVSHATEDLNVVQEALSIKADKKVIVMVPQRGEKRKALDQAMENTRQALHRHLSSHTVQRELLEAVARVFNLPAMPERIEVYDNSHISGTNAVGVMIVAGPEGFIKKAYRKFTIKSETLTPGDDYAMLKEVLSRRFRGLLEEPEAQTPDLVLIDGGAGQMTAACEVFNQMGISVNYAGIAKGADRNAGREWFHLPNQPPFQLPINDPVLHYLQRIRDEAHRFAIGFHRDKRSKEMQKSELDSIPQIGARRKKALLLHFGSARGVAGASMDDIARVPGINQELAQKIYEHFH